MDAGSPLLLLLVPLLLILVALAGLAVFIRLTGGLFERIEEGEEETAVGERAERPWWGSPLVWLAVGAAMVLLGVFVLPQFFGGAVFVLFPFFWVGGRRVRRVPSRRDR